jgi:hypothetical protein
MCCNPATEKVSYVDDWLSSKAINALLADSQYRPKFNGQGSPRAIYLGKKKTSSLGPITLAVMKPVTRLYSPRLPHQKLAIVAS